VVLRDRLSNHGLHITGETLRPRLPPHREEIGDVRTARPDQAQQLPDTPEFEA